MNMPYKTKVFATLLSAIALSVLVACSSSKTVEQKEYSGFLKDYSKLQPATSPSGDPVLRWVSPDLAKGNYTKIYLEKPVLFLGKEQKPNKQVSQQTMNDIVAYLGQQQEALLQRKMILADGPGPNTLHVRTAVTAVSTSTEGLNWYEAIPVAAVFAAASTAAGSRDKESAVFVEGEATDSLTGASLVQFARKGSGAMLENEDVQLTLKDVKPLLDRWVSEFYTQLQSLAKMP